MYQNVLSVLTKIKYIVIEQEMYCFNMQIQYMNFLVNTFNIIRENKSLNNFLCKYSIKQFKHVCKHSFPEIQKVKLRNIDERHVITLRKQLINLLYQSAWTILVKLGEINMIPLIILNKTQSFTIG